MATQLDARQIWLGSLALNSRDIAGIEWIATSLVGWNGSPASTAQPTQFGAADGAAVSAGYLTPRTITLTVEIGAHSPADLYPAIEQVIGAVPLTPFALRVIEGPYDRSATVQRTDVVDVTPYGSCAATVDITLIAGDPRRYSTTAHTGTCHLPSITGGLTFPMTFPFAIGATVSSGQITVANAGDYACSPLLRIYGPVQEPIVTLQRGNGAVQQLTYSDSLATGDYLDLDCSAHTAILDGQASRRGSISGDWPMIPPGTTAVLAFAAAAPSPSAQLAAAWWDTWM